MWRDALPWIRNTSCSICGSRVYMQAEHVSRDSVKFSDLVIFVFAGSRNVPFWGQMWRNALQWIQNTSCSICGSRVYMQAEHSSRDPTSICNLVILCLRKYAACLLATVAGALRVAAADLPLLHLHASLLDRKHVHLVIFVRKYARTSACVFAHLLRNPGTVSSCTADPPPPRVLRVCLDTRWFPLPRIFLAPKFSGAVFAPEFILGSESVSAKPCLPYRFASA